MTSVRIGKDRHGKFIRYRRRKIYITKAVSDKLAGMNEESLTKFLVKWIISRFSRRRRKARRAAKNKQYSGAPDSVATAPAVPLEAQRQALVSMSMLARPPEERARLEDHRREVKALADARSTRKFIEAPKQKTDPDDELLTVPGPDGKTGKISKGLFNAVGPQIQKTVAERDEAKRKAKTAETKFQGVLPDTIKGLDAIVKSNQQKIDQLRETHAGKLEKRKRIVEKGEGFDRIKGQDSLLKQLKSLGMSLSMYHTSDEYFHALRDRIREIQADKNLLAKYADELKKLPYLTKPEKLAEEAKNLEGQINSLQEESLQASAKLRELQEEDDEDPTAPVLRQLEPPKGIQLGGDEMPVVEPDSGSDSEASGSGLRSRTDPLTDQQIDDLMSDIPGYLGTVCRDEISGLAPRIAAAWRTGAPFGWISLTLTRNQATGNKVRPADVGHWVAVAVIPETQELAWYDSFGAPAPVDVKTTLKQIFDKVAPRTLLKFKENLIQEQSVNSDNCGWFCIQFLLDMFHGRPFTEATPYNRVRQSERNIEAFKKKFKPFSWL